MSRCLAGPVPAGADSRYTTNVESFFAARQEWLQANLPAGDTLLPVDEYGPADLPKIPSAARAFTPIESRFICAALLRQPHELSA